MMCSQEEHNCDVLCVDDTYGLTPLHSACVKGHLDIVQYLIKEQHCDPDCENTDGLTPLDLVYLNEHVNVIQYFSEELGYELGYDESGQ